MYTNRLDQEEREKFLELIYKLASSDGAIDEEELELIQEYQRELSVEDIPDTDSLSGLACYFGEKDLKVRKTVLFEVCQIILSDHNVGENEQKAFDYIKKVLALDPQVTEDIVSVANDLKIIRDRIYDLISI